MTAVIEVRFKGNRREFFLWEGDEPPALNRGVIVDADRGEDLGYVHATGEAAATRNAGTPHGFGAASPTRLALRLATGEEIRRERDLRHEDDDARRRAMERVQANKLVMKLSDAEWQWDRKKLTLYFTAERRVDFRTLVRELASMFRTRIELKQIGVRDEAKRLDGIGRCGRQYCSASWLPELRPVNLGVAKDQRLSLNPSQISGACGRLMCCLRYEHEFYVASRRRFPKEGRILRTAKGDEKVVANDIFRERVVLRAEDGETRTIPLEELRAELDALGTPLPVVGTPTSAVARDDDERAVEDERGLVGESDARDVAAVDVIAPADADDDEDAEAPADAHADAPGEGDPAARERRPHRRRGRRGGRRNRASEQGGRSPSADDRPPTES